MVRARRLGFGGWGCGARAVGGVHPSGTAVSCASGHLSWHAGVVCPRQGRRVFRPGVSLPARYLPWVGVLAALPGGACVCDCLRGNGAIPLRPPCMFARSGYSCNSPIWGCHGHHRRGAHSGHGRTVRRGRAHAARPPDGLQQAQAHVHPQGIRRPRLRPRSPPLGPPGRRIPQDDDQGIRRHHGAKDAAAKAAQPRHSRHNGRTSDEHVGVRFQRQVGGGGTRDRRHAPRRAAHALPAHGVGGRVRNAPRAARQRAMEQAPPKPLQVPRQAPLRPQRRVRRPP